MIEVISYLIVAGITLFFGLIALAGIAMAVFAVFSVVAVAIGLNQDQE